jgi:4a-hydroxytetrahydrobiopterin dehydratase
MDRIRVKLTGDDLSRHAAALPDWRVRDDRLSRSFRFDDFKTALAFVNRVGAVAEEQGHHPDIHLTWGRADVETWTHDAGGITASDFTLAAKIDEQFSKR